jgi:hypothetical protein
VRHADDVACSEVATIETPLGIIRFRHRINERARSDGNESVLTKMVPKQREG